MNVLEKWIPKRSSAREKVGRHATTIVRKGVHTGGISLESPEQVVRRSGKAYSEDLKKTVSEPLRITSSLQDFKQIIGDMYLIFGTEYVFDVVLTPKYGTTDIRTQGFLGKARIAYNMLTRTPECYVKLLAVQPQDVLLEKEGIIAAALSGRSAVRQTATQVLAGNCTGSTIDGIADFSHSIPAIACIDATLFGTAGSKILEQAAGKKIHTVAEAAHTHSLSQSKKLSGELVNASSKSLSLFEGTDSASAEILCTGNEQIHIIPFASVWENIEHERTATAQSLFDATAASIIIATAAHYSHEEMAHVSEAVQQSNRGISVPLNSLRSR